MRAGEDKSFSKCLTRALQELKKPPSFFLLEKEYLKLNSKLYYPFHFTTFFIKLVSFFDLEQ